MLTDEADRLIEGQYADRPALRPVLDAVLTAVLQLPDVAVNARKTMVTLVSPCRTFRSCRPARNSASTWACAWPEPRRRVGCWQRETSGRPPSDLP